MKISKKDLRRLIYENIISEQQSTATTSGARVTRGRGPGVDRQKREAFAEDIIRVVDEVLNAEGGVEEFNALFAIGRASVNIHRETATVNGESLGRSDLRALVAKIKAALKADSDISSTRELLRVGRRLKTTYEYIPNGDSETTPPVEEDESQPLPAPSPEPAPPTPSSKCDEKLEQVYNELELFGTSKPTSRGAAPDMQVPTVANGFQYPDDTTYRYYVSKVNGCWYALNIKSCKFFSLKDYEQNMENLDGYFVEARTQDMKIRCAGREEGDSVDPSDDSQGDPSDPGKSISPGATKPLTLREEALIMLMAGGTNNKLTYRGADLAILFEKGTDDAYREVIAQVKRQTNINSLQTAVTRFITPKSQSNGLLDLGNVTGGFNYTQAQAQHGAGGALKLALNRGAAFDLPGFDEYGFNRDHTTELRDALGKRLNAPGGTLNESAYGKSRGTLLRERYWGRY